MIAVAGQYLESHGRGHTGTILSQTWLKLKNEGREGMWGNKMKPSMKEVRGPCLKQKRNGGQFSSLGYNVATRGKPRQNPNELVLGLWIGVGEGGKESLHC